MNVDGYSNCNDKTAAVSSYVQLFVLNMLVA